LAKALVIAAPHSGSGKTLVTLGLLRALRNAGVDVASAKVGPDYIDPQFHAAATGKDCVNLDPWAMGPRLCRALLPTSELVLIEGVMGLFDGPQGASGSTADLAADLGLPVLLVIDCAHQAQSIAALVAGFIQHRPDVMVAGLFLNRVKSDRHLALLQDSLAGSGAPIVGLLRHSDSLVLPSRHLGLVQAMENQGLDDFLESAAAGVTRETKLDRIVQIAFEAANHKELPSLPMPPLAQSIAIARDEAFSFAYPHVLNGWRKAGAELNFFSPLNDEAPCGDAIYLPGGYPELHAGRLAANRKFLDGLRKHPGLVYGECGGYMVLGEGLVDAQGTRHSMAGLLPLETSFASRKLHLGYRQLTSLSPALPKQLRGHEFHYSKVVRESGAEPLFEAQNAAGESLRPMGLRHDKVMGSYAHIISVAP
jgi:cobyrinic acid a,c-diamide synthase